MKPPTAAQLRDRLGAAIGSRAPLIEALCASLQSSGEAGYLVGGPVRDLLLEQPVGDIDVLVPEHFERVAKELAHRLDGRAIVRPRFRTATVESSLGPVDLVGARSERYARPGALPSVRAACLDADLGRRDFSINCLAFAIYPEDGAVLDPEAGLADLRDMKLRALHPDSFVDDPTRMYRAARYASRLGLQFETRTRRWLRQALADDRVSLLSGARVLHEIVKLLDEENSTRAVATTKRLALFDAAVPGWLPSPPSAWRRWDRIKTAPPWPGAEASAEAGLALLLAGSESRTQRRVLKRLGLTGRAATRPLEAARAARRYARFLSALPSSGVLDARLADASDETLVCLYCALPAKSARLVASFASDLKLRPNPVTGRDAAALGLSGPQLGQYLRAARRRVLDGKPLDRNWQRRWLAARR